MTRPRPVSTAGAEKNRQLRWEVWAWPTSLRRQVHEASVLAGARTSTLACWTSTREQQLASTREVPGRVKAVGLLVAAAAAPLHVANTRCSMARRRDGAPRGRARGCRQKSGKGPGRRAFSLPAAMAVQNANSDRSRPPSTPPSRVGHLSVAVLPVLSCGSLGALPRGSLPPARVLLSGDELDALPRGSVPSSARIALRRRAQRTPARITSSSAPCSPATSLTHRASR